MFNRESLIIVALAIKTDSAQNVIGISHLAGEVEVTGQPGKIGSATKSYNKELGAWSQFAGSSLAGQFHVTGLMQHYRLRNENGRSGSSGAYRAMSSNRAAGQQNVTGQTGTRRNPGSRSSCGTRAAGQEAVPGQPGKRQ